MHPACSPEISPYGTLQEHKATSTGRFIGLSMVYFKNYVSNKARQQGFGQEHTHMGHRFRERNYIATTGTLNSIMVHRCFSLWLPIISTLGLRTTRTIHQNGSCGTVNILFSEVDQNPPCTLRNGYMVPNTGYFVYIEGRRRVQGVGFWELITLLPFCCCSSSAHPELKVVDTWIGNPYSA